MVDSRTRVYHFWFANRGDTPLICIILETNDFEDNSAGRGQNQKIEKKPRFFWTENSISLSIAEVERI